MSSTLLAGGTVVTLSPPSVARADVLLSGERIGAPSARPEGTAVLDCTGCLILQGLTVAHTHLYSALAAGMPGPSAAPSTFREILERVWWRLDRAIDPAALVSSAQIGAIAALRAGVTCLVDHHESPSFIDGSLDAVAEGLGTIGVRALLTYGATDRHGGRDAKRGLAESERFARRHAQDPMIRGMIGVHAPFTASDETLAGASDAARRLGLGVHLHVAEGPDDQLAARERWGRPVVEHLAELGILGPRSIAAHAVQISTGEAAVLAASGTWVTHQARSNMNNGVGYAGALATLDRVALGTDGIDNDVLAELSAAFFRRREHTGPSCWPDAPRMLARGGELFAELFGEPLARPGEGAEEDARAPLRPGDPADVVVFEYDPPTPLDAGSFGAHLLFGLKSGHVRDVFVRGRQVLRDRRPTMADEREVAARARQHARALFDRMPPG